MSRIEENSWYGYRFPEHGFTFGTEHAPQVDLLYVRGLGRTADQALIDSGLEHMNHLQYVPMLVTPDDAKKLNQRYPLDPKPPEVIQNVAYELNN